MRILCLHGSGASAAIMESQIANIRANLPSSYQFDFLDSPLKCGAAPELKEIYSGPYYRFLEEYSGDAMQKAVDFLHEVVEEDGPYDCVMGFSQGAAVAAAYITQQSQGDFEDAPFKMAVFICLAIIPPQIQLDISLDTMGVFGEIGIPTVHVIGINDPCNVQSMQIVKHCRQTEAQALQTRCGHEVPRDAADTKKIAVAIERAFRLAFSG